MLKTRPRINFSAYCGRVTRVQIVCNNLTSCGIIGVDMGIIGFLKWYLTKLLSV